MTQVTCAFCGLSYPSDQEHRCVPPRTARAPLPTAPLPVDVTPFLAELTALSRKHGLGIGGEPILFLMESGSSGDYERTYMVLGDRSEVEFR